MTPRTSVDKSTEDPQAILPGPGRNAWTPQAALPDEPLSQPAKSNTSSRMSPTETCAKSPDLYRRRHWVYDTATGYCAWCGERIDHK